MRLRLARAVARRAAAGRGGGRASPAAVRPPTCGVRVQVFDGVSSVLTCAGEGVDGARVAPLEPCAARRMAGPALRLLGLKVDVNRASVEDLQALPGVGPKLAERLVAARPYRSLAELRGVPGIGPKRFVELSEAVTVGEEGRRVCADHL